MGMQGLSEPACFLRAPRIYNDVSLRVNIEKDAMADNRQKAAFLNLRLDPALKAALAKAAADDHRTITGLLEKLITEHLRSIGALPSKATSKRK